MDAIEFIKERHRMCNFYKSCKIKGCPAENLSCDSLEEIAIQEFKLIRDVEQWSKEHPRKQFYRIFWKSIQMLNLMMMESLNHVRIG